MKLLYTPIKGYTHTVEAVIAYADLERRIEGVATRPFDPATTLGEVNPLGTVPTLIADAGESVYGGLVIYEYLDSLHDRPRLYPASGPARWSALRQAWLADGIFDATVRLIVESWEKRGAQRASYIARTWSKVTRGLDQLERDAQAFGPLTIGQVRAVGALAFLDLKMAGLGKAVEGLDPGFAWRTGRPTLAAWYERARPNPIFSFNLASPT
jgi:glutathione S-transferase